jgi:hypothetical protein
LTNPFRVRIYISSKMSLAAAKVRFEQDGAELTAIEIVRNRLSPAVVPLYRVLLGLGIVIASYQARPSGSSLAERMVLQRRDGGTIDARLTAETKAAILPLVLDSDAV